MKIHKQGFLTIAFAGIFLAIIAAIVLLFITALWLLIPIIAIIAVLFFLILWFFRIPQRHFVLNDKYVYAPADGKVVVIEETFENEYFKDDRIQVSIFMSPLNIHVNYYPIGGVIDYMKYHRGKYLVAWHPKSSFENERSTIVIKNSNNTILVRQIAGALARRIITNSRIDQHVKQCEELGFIKFGSRLDVFLPKSAKIVARLNQVTRAGLTVIAEL
ncbi:MAG: phosphatidylserine decarboxylase family protein [Bacteroidales bacterium]|nr:phosphatidylserine decarboxylase family protein [Bacteroidales bacterium]